MSLPPFPGRHFVDKAGNLTPVWESWFTRLLQALGNPVTVADLPDAAGVGANGRSFVTDATVTTFGSVVVGGGANAVPVFSDGVDWRIG